MTNPLTVTLHARVEPIPGDCPICGYTALRWTRIYRLDEHGVTLGLERLFCGRCKLERRQ